MWLQHQKAEPHFKWYILIQKWPSNEFFTEVLRVDSPGSRETCSQTGGDYSSTLSWSLSSPSLSVSFAHSDKEEAAFTWLHSAGLKEIKKLLPPLISSQLLSRLCLCFSQEISARTPSPRNVTPTQLSQCCEWKKLTGNICTVAPLGVEKWGDAIRRWKGISIE